jgi:hypothetical protein
MLQGSRTGLFSGSSAGDPYPLRIPLDKLGAAVSPTSEPRKDNVLPPVAPENTSCPSPECSQFDDLSSDWACFPLFQYSISPEEHRHD